MNHLDGENRLVKQFKAGDASAFEVIMKHYEPYVMGLTLRMIGDRATAEDICQEVFVKVLKGLRRFREGSTLKTWIFRIAHNTVVDHVRSSKNLEEPLEEPENGTKHEATESSPLNTLAEEQLRLEITKSMKSLQPQVREIVHLFYWDQLSVGEIGEAMDLPAGTVKTHLFRARKKLRETIEHSAGGIRQ